jgi:hypothetical protein
VRKHGGVNGIGLGTLAGRFRNSADVAGIHDGHRHACGNERSDRRHVNVAGRFEDDQVRSEGLNPIEKTRNAMVIVREAADGADRAACAVKIGF